MTSRRELLAGLGAAIALAGCSTGNEDGTESPPASTTRGSTPTDAPPTTTQSPTETSEDTPTETPPEDTPTETPPEDTPTETPPEDTPTPTPEPEPDPKSFEEIYQEQMVNYSGVGKIIDWNDVRYELENNQGHNLDNLEVNSNFIEDLAAQVDTRVSDYQSAEGLAYGLYEEFNIGTGQVIVDARTANDGMQGHITSILIKQNDGGVVKDMNNLHDGKPNTEGNPWYKTHNENTNLSFGEQTLKNIWDSAKAGIRNWLDKDGIEAMIESRTGNITDGGQNTLSRLNDDLVIGYESENHADPEKGGEVVYTESAFDQVGEVLDPKNINANPRTTGVQARNLVMNATEQYYNNVDREAGDFLAIGFDGEDFTYNIVDKDRKEELEHQLLSEYLEE